MPAKVAAPAAKVLDSPGMATEAITLMSSTAVSLNSSTIIPDEGTGMHDAVLGEVSAVQDEDAAAVADKSDFLGIMRNKGLCLKSFMH